MTERKRAEIALQESESRYRSLSQEFHALLDDLPDAIILVTPDHRVIWANRRTISLSGMELSQMTGECCYKVRYERTAPCEVCAMHATLKTGEPASHLKDAPDGRTFETRAVPVKDSDGMIVSVIMIGRDMTEQRHLEAQLRQAQKIEAIGTLAGGIAHDFNNILAAIFGYTEMALLNLPEESPLRHYLKQVLKASDRAKDLVKQILIFSRYNHAQERSPVDIKPIVKEAVKFLRASLPTTIEIRQSITNEPSIALADPTQIHQVLINLCTNAAHAMEEKGGLIEVSLKEVELLGCDALNHPDLKPGAYLKLTVSDTGHGMDKATVERIFDPYFTTKAVGKGTGLGLAVVHGIVKRHEGVISVESEPERGSTFEILIPRIEAVPKEEKISGDPLPHGTGRILYVDDERSLVDIGTRMLESLGYEPVGFTSSTEALEIFRSNPNRFDLVVTDYTMPQMTGEDLARELLAIRRDIPIILATGFSERITEQRAGEIGIREFVMKPLSMRELAEAVRRALNNNGS